MRRCGWVRSRRRRKRLAFLGPHSGQAHLLHRAGRGSTQSCCVRMIVPLGHWGLFSVAGLRSSALAFPFPGAGAFSRSTPRGKLLLGLSSEGGGSPWSSAARGLRRAPPPEPAAAAPPNRAAAGHRVDEEPPMLTPRDEHADTAEGKAPALQGPCADAGGKADRPQPGTAIAARPCAPLEARGILRMALPPAFRSARHRLSNRGGPAARLAFFGIWWRALSPEGIGHGKAKGTTVRIWGVGPAW